MSAALDNLEAQLRRARYDIDLDECLALVDRAKAEVAEEWAVGDGFGGIDGRDTWATREDALRYGPHLGCCNRPLMRRYRTEWEEA